MGRGLFMAKVARLTGQSLYIQKIMICWEWETVYRCSAAIWAMISRQDIHSSSRCSGVDDIAARGKVYYPPFG